MPTVKVPIPDYTEIRELKKAAVRKKLELRVALYEQQKEVAGKLDELNFELYGELQSALPEGVKSVAFEGYQITAMQGSARRSFSVKKLLEQLFKCPHCKKDVTVPVKTTEKSYVVGAIPKPTVSVRALRGDGGSDGDGEDE